MKSFLRVHYLKMRRNGWELPYHPLQVIAVAGFLALGFSFYIFFVPFVEYSILEICGLVAYSITILVVFSLYTLCVASDPADIRVMSLKQQGPAGKSFETVSLEPPQAQGQSSSFLQLPKVHICPRNTCISMPNVQDLLPENGSLYCSLCNVAISLRTKHCRVCDKCVDGFDHHCWWLNNCIGRRNYKAFIILIVAALFMLMLQWSFGIWIVVQRLLRERQYKSLISQKLGRSFPSLGHLLVLVVCTIVAMVAFSVLAQLVFFHAFLIKKGLTTYEYILAKRKQKRHVEAKCLSKTLLIPGPASDAAAKFQQQKIIEPISPNHEPLEESLGLKQEETDLDGSWRSLSQGFLTRKASVKINPWNLSFACKAEDAQLASTSMHESIGQPVSVAKEMESSFGSSQGFSADLVASCGIGNGSRRFCEVNSGRLDGLILSAWQNGKLPLDTFEPLDSSENDSGSLSHPVVRNNALNPLQREARSVFKSSHSFSSGVSGPTPCATSSFEAVDSKVSCESHHKEALV